ncbi:MAG: hypothetical protein AAB425_14595, partial [Bdellovibrionota bacterium]
MITLFFIAVTGVAWAEYDPTADLLMAFGDRCPMSYGTLNDPALVDNEALKTIVRSIRDDEDCKGVTGALDALYGGITSASVLVPDETELARQEQLEYCAQVEESLEGMDPDSTDPIDISVLASLESELISCRTYLVTAYPLTAASFDTQELRYDAAANLNTYTIALFAALNTADKCLTKNPSIPAQILAQVAGLSGALLGGVEGALILSGGVLMDQLIGFIKDHRLNRILQKLTDSSEVTGVSCALEGRAETYCDAVESEKALAVQLESRQGSVENACLWEGYRLTQNDLSPYLEWISKLESGGGSTTNSEALATQQSIIQTRASIQTTRLILGQYRNAYKKLTPSEVNNAMKGYLSSMRYSLGELWGTSTFITDSREWCGVLVFLNTGGAEVSRDAAGLSDSSLSCDAYITSRFPTPPTMDQFEANVNLYLSKIESYVAEKSKTIASDPDGIVTAALIGRPTSASTFLEDGSHYLAWLIEDYQRRLDKDALTKKERLVMETRLNAALAIHIRMSKASKVIVDPLLKNEGRTNELFALLIIDNDPNLLSERFQAIVSEDMSMRLGRGEVSDSLSDILRYSTTQSMGEVVSHLSTFSGGSAAAQAQLNDAKRVATDNLRTFGDMVQNSVEASFGELKRRSKNKDDPATYAESFAKLCMSSLLVPNGTHLKNGKCKGQVWTDKGTGLEMHFDEIKAKPFEDRVCTLH